LNVLAPMFRYGPSGKVCGIWSGRDEFWKRWLVSCRFFLRPHITHPPIYPHSSNSEFIRHIKQQRPFGIEWPLHMSYWVMWLKSIFLVYPQHLSEYCKKPLLTHHRHQHY
jgi:hypothetical protein